MRLLRAPVVQRELEQIGQVYKIERWLKALGVDARQRPRQEYSKPLFDALHACLWLNRQKVTDGSATAKTLDYSLLRWQALPRFLDDGQLRVDNNQIENQIRPIS
jgi:transposase